MSHFQSGASVRSAGLITWESFAEHGQRWIRARLIVGTLFEIRDDFRYLISVHGQLNPHDADKLFSRLKAAVNAENEYWATNRASAITKSGQLPHG
jgi:hypothetical protein